VNESRNRNAIRTADSILVARLNARLQPVHRGELYEDPLDEELQRAKIGYVDGGGTSLRATGEIDTCDIELRVHNLSLETIRFVIDAIETLGAPKGSYLRIEAEGREIPFGAAEGLAVYLNGTDLPESTYAECDSNFVHDEFTRLLGSSGRVLSYWEGSTETALYMYGQSAEDIKSKLSDFISTYPLCDRCRIERIA